MKKILSLLLILPSLFSCKNQDDITANYANFSWYTSQSYEDADYKINIDDFITFLDLSENSITNQFIIPTSAKFIEGNFVHGTGDYSQYIIPNQTNTTSKKLVNVIFTESGMQQVVIKDTFAEKVDESKEVNGKWLVNKTFTVDVFNKTNPSFTISKYDNSDPKNPTFTDIISITEDDNPKIEDKNSWTTTTIEAGESLAFLDQSTQGRPTSRSWSTTGGNPETSSQDSSIVAYNKPGEYTATITSSRSGNNIPSYSSEKLIPLLIKVIPSTKPFVINGGVSLTNDTISFHVSGNVETLINQESKFLIHVTNELANYEGNIDISSVTASANDATKVNITLGAPIYNTDVLTLSFTDGEVISIDGRKLTNFDNEPIKQNSEKSILDEDLASFETKKSSLVSAFCRGYFAGKGKANGTKDQPTFSRTTDTANDGIASMKYTFNGIKTTNLDFQDFAKPNGISAGTYLVSYMVYLETGNTMQQFNTKIILDDADETEVSTLAWSLAEADVARGKWVKITQIITTEYISSGTMFRINIAEEDNPDTVGQQTIYFDNLEWIELNPRP